jgi:hypothetical protein
MDEELLTVEDARKRLGIGRGAFANLAQRQGLPRFTGPADAKGRPRVLFRAGDVERLRELVHWTRRQGAPPPA